MKLLSFQPFSLYSNGGGSRILRRLYQGREEDIISLVISPYKLKNSSAAIKEIAITSYPPIKPWMRSFLRVFVFWLSKMCLKEKTVRKLRKEARKLDFDVLHVIDHGIFSDALCDETTLQGKQLWVSFHDYFSTSGSTFQSTKTLWQKSKRRFVISDEMGKKYQKLFGQKKFELVTDGLYFNEISLNDVVWGNEAVVYFSGLLHAEYYPLFKCLADTLDHLAEKGYLFKLILRGTQELEFLRHRKFGLEYRPFSLDNNELKAELDSAHILYLPIKFTNRDFYLYSLSTKMVGYLGAPGAILYHGPEESAANRFLSSYNAAVSCTSTSKDELATAILETKSNYHKYSHNAKKVAEEVFLITKIQQRFWEESKVQIS